MTTVIPQLKMGLGMRAKSLKLCLTLCYPMDCSPQGFSVHMILQARILEWVALSPPGDLPDPGIELASPVSPALWEASLHTEALGKPYVIDTI